MKKTIDAKKKLALHQTTIAVLTDERWLATAAGGLIARCMSSKSRGPEDDCGSIGLA